MKRRRRITRLSCWLAVALALWSGGPEGQRRADGGLLEKLFGKKPDTSGAAEDGDYTILLYVCRLPNGHVQQAKYYKYATEQLSGWKHLFIVHKEDHSLLYWGKYETLEAAQPNLKIAKAYETPAKVRLYSKAIIVPLPGKEDPGPPQWRLDQTPAKYVHTVLIAEFYDVPEADYVGRKKFAADYCKQLRDQGHLAFYKHDATSSIVTVGLFERTSVRVLRKDRKVERQVVDPRINSIFARFPDLAVNGRQKLLKTIDPKNRTVKHIPAPTYVMVIPREKKPDDATTQPAREGDRPGDPEPRKAPGDPPSAVGPAGPGGRPDRPAGD